MSSRITNLHAFMVKLTRDGTFNAISAALSALRMVLGGLVIHPSDLLFYNPVAVVNGTAQKVSYPADPYRSEALTSEDTLFQAEAAFKAAASWIKIVGKEFFVRFAEHESFIPEWLFWTKRFEEISQSRFAGAEVKQLAIECAESMTVISVKALDFESLKNSLGCETTGSCKSWVNSPTVKDYLTKAQQEWERSRVVVTDTQPPILFNTWWEILTSDVAYGFKARSACHAATAR